MRCLRLLPCSWCDASHSWQARLGCTAWRSAAQHCLDASVSPPPPHTHTQTHTTLPTPQTYTARHAVVSVPLGVLKANKIAFSPALSSAKQAAIRNVGFGTLDKVCGPYLRPNSPLQPAWPPLPSLLRAGPAGA
jgi:hypothetical protein